MPERTYDVIVIGGGSTGENVAQRGCGGCGGGRRGGTGGRRVLVLGLHAEQLAAAAARALAEARAVAGAADAVTGSLDVGAVLARRNRFVHDWDDASQLSWLDDNGLDLVRGHGRLVSDRRVMVDKRNGARSSSGRRRPSPCAPAAGRPCRRCWPTPGRGPAATPQVRRAFRRLAIVGVAWWRARWPPSSAPSGHR